MPPGFLIEYHRPSGELKVTPFDSFLDATLARLERDKANQNPDLEIVAIASSDEQSLRASHSRYFSRLETITRQGTTALAG